MVKKPKREYSQMHNALLPLEANAAYVDDSDDDDRIGTILEDDEKLFATLHLDFTIVGAMGTEPKSMDEVL